MDANEILNWCENQKNKNDFIEFGEVLFSELTEDNAKIITQKFGYNTLMKLPKKEIDFFEWLKVNDTKIWNDLWNADVEPYIVSMNFLPIILDNTRGFPICDLLENDNYYFTKSHMVDKDSELLIQSVQEMYMDKKQLTVEQTLVLEISLAPIDIWRFCYRYGIAIDRAKTAVENLKTDGILVHLITAEHLANFIEI